MAITKYKYLFGPVNSRRLGVSLGVDLAPRKVCTLDCVYCEVGATTVLTTERKEYVKYEKVVTEITDYINSQPKPDYITITGSGEPTLNIRFGDVINFIKTNYPGIKVAVLTNGTLMIDPQVRSEMLNADLVMPSLDAVSKEVFERIDKPESSIDMGEYIQGIADFRDEFNGELNLEILFLKGYNDGDKELKLLKDAILKIKPDKVQLNTLDRPGVEKDLIPLSKFELEELVGKLNLENIEIIARHNQKSPNSANITDLKSSILETLKRRPVTVEDLVSVINLSYEESVFNLEELVKEGRAEKVYESSGIFYRFLVKKKEKRN